MLRITNDGRKLALDQRLMNPLLPDDPGSKANACVDKVYEIWEQTKAQRSAQHDFLRPHHTQGGRLRRIQ